ncbi:MAG TPA: helix-turn-helix domain-containing protein [Solirubrobacteraceae bacterium]|jgi:AcrR family transcriptional regulator
MRARAQAAERLSEQIVDATFELWLERAYDEITLQLIAERAGVSLSTVLRRFGSKEGVVEAIIATDRYGELDTRASVAAGDADAAVRVLVDGYERAGDAVLRNLALEERIDAVASWVELGRARHREWIERVFTPWLPSRKGPEYRRRRAQLIVATDLYTWKILRRDQGLSRQETERAMRDLVARLIEED